MNILNISLETHQQKEKKKPKEVLTSVISHFQQLSQYKYIAFSCSCCYPLTFSLN